MKSKMIMTIQIFYSINKKFKEIQVNFCLPTTRRCVLLTSNQSFYAKINIIEEMD